MAFGPPSFLLAKGRDVHVVIGFLAFQKKLDRIAERLAGRVKGLTARFDVLLVTQGVSAAGARRASRP
jgi:hypothetical protein